MEDLVQNQTYSKAELEGLDWKFVHGIGPNHAVWFRKIINGSEHKLFSLFLLSGTEDDPHFIYDGVVFHGG